MATSHSKKITEDQFFISIKDILDEIEAAGTEAALEAVYAGLKVGVREWRRDADESIGKHEYRRSGEVITSGKYMRSIRSHMLSTDSAHPLGEIGSKKLAGLSHLLEKGHGRVGGGRVEPVLHIAKEVVPAAFDAAVAAANQTIANVLD